MNPWITASVAEELHFLFDFILINFNLNTHKWLVLDIAGLDVKT